MFDFEDEIRLDTCGSWQEVIEDLLCCHIKFFALSGNFVPTSFVFEILLSEIFCAHVNGVAVICQIHALILAPRTLVSGRIGK